YQMMRQNIFENRKRQTPKMTFVFVLSFIFKSFFLFYPIDKTNFYSIIHLYEFKEFLEYARKEKSVTCFRDLVYHSWSAVAGGKFDFGYYWSSLS
ncbi:hypothetical protein, partial [Streptococcus sp. oral taxon 431]|uniref:hypothetical protein n=1 Tax=Streptococcus sp. oral taxon 431 TaxID=712633 RepID=UPI002002C798